MSGAIRHGTSLTAVLRYGHFSLVRQTACIANMTNSRPPVTGRDAAGAGALMLSANAMCAGVGAGIGALVGATIPLLLIGFFIGFFVGIFVVARRFRGL